MYIFFIKVTKLLLLILLILPLYISSINEADVLSTACYKKIFVILFYVICM